MARGIGKYSTDASFEAPIIPSVKVNYTQLLINGQFVDAASGEFSVNRATQLFEFLNFGAIHMFINNFPSG